MLRVSIEKLLHKENLDSQLCAAAMLEMLNSDTSCAQAAAFLVLLRAKQETPEELAALVTTLKKQMIPIATTHAVLDIVGTGGDGANTVNISTGSAILAASCGLKIAKHGNRASSSLAGAADVLEALGVAINLSAEKVRQCIDEVGIGFCYFPNFHPTLSALRALRKQLNVPTCLNLLGPLLNPAQAQQYLLGVYSEQLVKPMAQTLQRLGCQRSMVVHGCGIDEISTLGPATISEIDADGINTYLFDPKQLGFARCQLSDLRGGDANINAQLLLSAFKGKQSAIADTLCLNAAVALYLKQRFDSIAEALIHSRENLYNGAALSLLNRWIECSHD